MSLQASRTVVSVNKDLSFDPNALQEEMGKFISEDVNGDSHAKETTSSMKSTKTLVRPFCSICLFAYLGCLGNHTMLFNLSNFLCICPPPHSYYAVYFVPFTLDSSAFLVIIIK